MSSTAEWLDRQLQGRNPGQELPYDPDVKWAIRQQLLDLVATFPTLTLHIRDYTHTNGRSAPLFVAEGTLPMFYQGVKYNIPIAIWLSEKYPRQPPIMYVVPTHDMVIKPRHSFVTPSGVVNSEYLRNWTFRSSLEVLGHDTSIHFGEEPPLFQRPPNAPSPVQSPPPPQPPRSQPSPGQQYNHSDTFQNPIRTNQSSSYPSSNPSSSYPSPAHSGGYPGSNVTPSNDGGSLWGGITAAASHRPQDASNRAQQSPERWNPTPPRNPTPPAKPQGPDLKAIFKEAAIKTLSDRLTASISAANEQTARETDQLFNDQAELGRRSKALDEGLTQAQNERSALEGSVVELTGKRVALDRWIAENESKAQQEDVDPDKAIVAADVLSQQALDAQAEDLALEDTLYSLNKACQEGVISAEIYMKQVRNVCYKQFFVRALGTKVAQKQQEMRRVASQRAPPSVQMTQGDLWSNPGVMAR